MFKLSDMNSFWSKFLSRIFFKSTRSTDGEKLQATSDIQGGTPAEPPTPRLEEASTPASFQYTPTDQSMISETFEYQTPRRASPIQRRRSLHLSELDSSQKADPSFATLCDTLAASNAIMSTSQALLAASTSTIAKTQRIAAEKELNENSKLRSLESEDFIQFLVKLNPKS